MSIRNRPLGQREHAGIFRGLVALLSIIPAAVEGAGSTRLSGYRVDAWGTEQGLPQSSVSAVAQTPDGYLWLGTEEGLVRFDGQRFAVFDRKSVPQMRSPYVRAALAARDGSLWLGTVGGALRYMDGSFRAYTRSDGLPGDDVMALAEDASGAVWIATTKGLVRFQGGALRTFTVREGLPDEHVWAIANGRRGLWVGTRKGVALVRDGRITAAGAPEKLSGRGVRALIEDRSGALWVATDGGGLFRSQDGVLKAFARRDGLPSDFVLALFEDREGAVWVGTNGGGLARFESGRLRVFGTADGLSSDLVLTLFEDREGNLWAGTTTGGVNRLRPRLFANHGTTQGLSHDITLAVLEDRLGALWVGTAGAGLNHIQGGRVRRYTKRDGLPSDLILSLAEDVAGGLWVGTNAGLGLLRDGQVQTFGTRDGLPSEAFVALCASRDGSIWVGTHGGGLARLKDGAVTTYTTAEGLPDDRVWWISEAAGGGFWIGTSGGVARLAEGRFSRVAARLGLADHEVFGVHEDGDGTLWIGTTGGGLLRYRAGEVAAITTRQGLFDDTVFRILDDARGHLWMSSNKGVFKVRKQDLHDVAEGRRPSVLSVSYGKADGMENAECNGGISPAGWRTRDGRLWFPTIRGLAVVDPERMVKAAGPPPIVIEDVTADGEGIGLRGAARLAAGVRRVQFRYTAPTMTAPEKTAFRFRLDGFDNDWVEAGRRRNAEYTGLRPGRYVFRVTSANRDGIWNAEEASFPFEVAPRFYQTWTFYALCVLAAAMAGELVHRWRAKQAEGKRLESLVAARTQALNEATVALARNEARFRALIENSSDVVLVVDEEGRLRHASSAVESVLGHAPPTLLGSPVLDFVHAEDATIVAAIFGTGGADVRSSAPLKFRARHRDGSWRLLEAVSTNLHRDPAVGGTVVNARDVTARERLEAQLRQAQKMEAVGRLAGGIAHDFNNLLGVILGYSQLLLQRACADDPARRKLEGVKLAAERAASLTRQLLAFSRRDAVQPELVEVGAVVSGLTEMLRRLLPEDVALVTVVPPIAGRVRADRTQLEQVIMNLVVNARDAMPGGGKIVIEVDDFEADEAFARASGCAPGRHVTLAVSDTGIGMDAETRQRIFEPFFTTKEAGKGTGLGLATVFGVVQQSGGHTQVDSEPGQGTTFRIYFPGVATISEAAAAPARPQEQPRGSETVLVVEDEVSLRTITREILEDLGYRVIEASNGAEALRLRRSHDGDVHLLLTDVVMPEMGGRDVAARLAAIDPGLPALYMSGYTDDIVGQRGVVARETDFLQKPFTADVLAVKVREVLDRPRTTDSGGDRMQA